MPTQINSFRHIDAKLKATIMENRGRQKVIERIITAYGVMSRQALCKHFGISQGIMANRDARDTFPADRVLICSIETGTSIEWLSFGSESSASTSERNSPEGPTQSNSVIDDYVHVANNPIKTTINPNQGGKAAIKRLLEAYGFTIRQALADHLQVSESTLASRYMRDTFSADWIIRCTPETGAFLQWLSFGIGSAFPVSKKSETTPSINNATTNVVMVKQKKIIDGVLCDDNIYSLDRALLSASLKNPLVVRDSNKSYLADETCSEFTDGKWMIEIEGKISIKNLIKMLLGKFLLTTSCPSITFQCMAKEIKPIAKCYDYLMVEIF